MACFFSNIYFIYLPQEKKKYNKVHYKYLSRKKKEQAKYRITTKAGMEIRGVNKTSLSMEKAIYFFLMLESLNSVFVTNFIYKVTD